MLSIWTRLILLINPLPHNQSPVKKILKHGAFENIVGKGENDGNQHFLFFSPCFLPKERKITRTFATFNLLYVNVFNLVKARVLFFGENPKSHQALGRGL